MWWEVFQEKLMFRMLWNTAMLLEKRKCIHESFPSEHVRS